MSDTVESARHLIHHGDNLLKLGVWDSANYAYYRAFYIMKLHKFDANSFLTLSNCFKNMDDYCHAKAVLDYILTHFVFTTMAGA